MARYSAAASSRRKRTLSGVAVSTVSGTSSSDRRFCRRRWSMMRFRSTRNSQLRKLTTPSGSASHARQKASCTMSSASGRLRHSPCAYSSAAA